MADKAVSELVKATQVRSGDKFVLEQDGTAKQLDAQVLENWLLAMADGHGGIRSIEKKGSAGLTDTYRITLADAAVLDFTVTNGRGILDISYISSDGLVDTYRISYNDGSSFSYTITNGAKGDKGDNTYTHIKFASQEPTEASHSFGDVPDEWVGWYWGPLADAPTDWKMYKWYRQRGDKGDTGDAATLVSAVVEYQAGTSGTIIPSGEWKTNVPPVTQGNFLWTRITQRFNTGSPIVSYSVCRFGVDGTGSVSSVCGVGPGPNGDVALSAGDVGALPIGGGAMLGTLDMNGQQLVGLNAPANENGAANKGYVDGRTNDFVVAHGTSGDWAYRKWNSGLAECWITSRFTVDLTKAWGELFESTKSVGGFAYPFTFTEEPIESATLVSTGSGAMLEASNKASRTISGMFYLVRATSSTGLNFYINSYTVGRWK